MFGQGDFLIDPTATTPEQIARNRRLFEAMMKPGQVRYAGEGAMKGLAAAIGGFGIGRDNKRETAGRNEFRDMLRETLFGGSDGGSGGGYGGGSYSGGTGGATPSSRAPVDPNPGFDFTGGMMIDDPALTFGANPQAATDTIDVQADPLMRNYGLRSGSSSVQPDPMMGQGLSFGGEQPRPNIQTGIMGGVDDFRMQASALPGGIGWSQVDGPNGPMWVSNDFLRDENGNYIRGSAELAAQMAEQYGGRLPQTPAEVDAIAGAAGQQVPFIASGQFAGPGIYPGDMPHEEMVRLHNEALAGYEVGDGLVDGPLKTIMANGGIYHPEIQPFGVPHSGDYADYSQGIRLVRDDAPPGDAERLSFGFNQDLMTPEGNALLAGRDLPEPPAPMREAFEVAGRQLGMNEREQNAALREYLSNGGVNQDPAVRAWCADYVNATLGHVGLDGTGSGMARSFLDWGVPTDSPQQGDVAVFSRGDPNGPYGHVGFFDGYDENGNIRVLGGNQSDSVSIASYPSDRLLGFRTAEGLQTTASARNPQLEEIGSVSGVPIYDPASLPQGQPAQPTASTQGRSEPPPRPSAGGQLAQAGGGMNDASMAQLYELMLNPWASPQERAVIGSMIEQRMQANDPLRQIQLQTAQLQLERLRNPQTGELPADARMYEYWLSQGYSPEEAFAATGGGGPLVDFAGANFGTGQGLSPYQEGMQDAAVERHNAILEQAQSSNEFLGDLQTLAELSPQFQGGATAGLNRTIGQLAAAVGADVDPRVSAQEQYESIIARLAPRMRVPGSGASSDFEGRQFLQSLPQAGNTPEGRAMINQTLQTIAQHQLAAAEIVRRAQRGDMDWVEADAAIEALGTPYEAFNQWRVTDGQQPGSRVDPSAQTPQTPGQPLPPSQSGSGLTDEDLQYLGR
jgi:uncharacterized protein (TIGR02594 family)